MILYFIKDEDLKDVCGGVKPNAGGQHPEGHDPNTNWWDKHKPGHTFS